METDLDRCYETVKKLTKEAGAIIKTRIWDTKRDLQLKSCDIDLVTDTDQEVEQLLISGLKKEFSNHKFIGEESVAGGEKCILTSEPTWIIDPVDGTMNFVHGYPNVCISVALLVNQVPEIGIIYNPILEHFFEARRGKGSYLNGKKITASKEKELSKALVGIEFGTSREEEKMKIVTENVNTLIPLIHGARSAGSAAVNMAYVALGVADAYFEFGIHAWDVAAGDLLVREAGGVVLDPAGEPFDILSRRVLCAGTQELVDQIVKVIKQYYPERD